MKLNIIVYSVLAVIGAALPLSQFIPWLGDNGFDIPALLAELFSTRIGAFFGWDVIVSALVLLFFIVVEGRRQEMRRLWIAIMCTLSVGVSFGLPVFLAMREHHMGDRQG